MQEAMQESTLETTEAPTLEGAGKIEFNVLYLKKLLEIFEKMKHGEKVSQELFLIAVALGRAAGVPEAEIANMECAVHRFQNGELN